MRPWIARASFVVLLTATFACKHPGTSTDQSTLASAASGQVGQPVPDAFLQAYRDYLGFYSKTAYPALAAKYPVTKQVLYGNQSGPYELQSTDVDKLARKTDFTPDADPNYNIECTPTFIQALSSFNGKKVDFHGTVVMVHGFSACPQQFYDLAVKLSQLGYHAFIPVMPGQGRGPAPAGAEKGQAPTGIADMGAYYSGFMPNYIEEYRYWKYASYINSIVANLPGDKFAMGLSGGAAVAHLIAIEKPDMYKRALLLSTYYHQRDRSIPDPVYDSSVPPKDPALLAMLNTSRNWGQYCYDNTLLGRRGICDLKYSAITGLNRYAANLIAYIKDQVPKRPTWPKIQYVTIENDGGADTVLNAQVFQIQHTAKPNAMSMCFYRNIPHPFLSKYDLPGADLYWMPSFSQQAIDFVKTGKFFLEDAPSVEATADLPFRLCYIPKADMPSK